MTVPKFTKIRNLCAVGAALMTVASASASILLIIDVTEPASVDILAVGGPADVNDAVTATNQGVSILEFFTADSSVPIDQRFPTGDLSPAGSGDIYGNYIIGSVGTLTDRDINIYYSSGTVFQNFSTMSPAFTGIATLDLTGTALPAGGATGDIFSGDTQNPLGQVIGQWQTVAVPEPNTVVLFGLSSVLLLLRRWRSACV